MKSLLKFLDALMSPVYGCFGGPKDYKPEAYHVKTWFIIAFAVSAVLVVADFIGWRLDWRVERFASMAWIATLICRLVLVEREIGELKARLSLR